jgi:hypothetical protein
LTTDVLARPAILGLAADADPAFHNGVAARRCGRIAMESIDRVAEHDDTQDPHAALRSSVRPFPLTKTAPASGAGDGYRKTRMALNTIRITSPAARKAERERDQAAALREYAAESAALQAKTARLRALRLAKQVSDAQTAIGPRTTSAAAPRRSGARRP